MQNYKILGPKETGKGILIEMDAGYVSPTEKHNQTFLQESLRAGRFGKATQGSEKQDSLRISVEQRIEALQAEAKYIGVSNAEREYGVMLAELEAQAKRASIDIDSKQLALLKQLVMERDSARSIDKLNQYVAEQQKNIDLVKLEGQAIGMSARQHKQLVDARNLELQIAKETRGMQAEDAKAYAETARSLFLVKQALEDVNYANSRAFGTGATSAIKDYMKGLGDAAKDANTLFSNAFKGMEDAMVDAFSTGKLSFKSMIDTMMADITRLIIRQALLKPLYQSMGLTEGGSGINVGSLLSAGASFFGNVGTASTYGTSVGSQQTSMLAAQDAGFGFFADGTNNIPYDNYPAILHKGEAVVPAKYNPAVGGAGGGNITYSPTINIDSRTDANEVRALVGRAVQQGQYELVDKINRGQVRIRT
jgi:lambda family phage tail tape measure protein